MLTYSDYDAYCKKESSTHITEFLLQSSTSLMYFTMSTLTQSFIKSHLLRLSKIHLIDAFIEILTAIGYIPYFNNIGYYLSDDVIPKAENDIGAKELYSQKTEAFNRVLPLAMWEFLEYKKIIPSLISGEIYNPTEISMTIFRILYYDNLHLTQPNLNYNSSNELLNDYHLHSLIETNAIFEHLLIPIYIAKHLSPAIEHNEVFNIVFEETLKEAYLEFSKGLEFRAWAKIYEFYSYNLPIEDISLTILETCPNISNENLVGNNSFYLI